MSDSFSKLEPNDLATDQKKKNLTDQLVIMDNIKLRGKNPLTTFIVDYRYYYPPPPSTLIRQLLAGKLSG